MNAADALIEFCLSLPHLAVHVDKWNATAASGVFAGLPTCPAEAQAVRQSLPQLRDDVQLVRAALSLPLLEPLSRQRLLQLTRVAMAALSAALSAAAAQSLAAAAAATTTATAAAAASSSSSTNPTAGNREPIRGFTVSFS